MSFENKEKMSHDNMQDARYLDYHSLSDTMPSIKREENFGSWVSYK